jgi:GT2 family glycosyltransferase
MATASDSPTVLIGMPVFRGRELVPESLRSILDQTFGDYRVLVSIDGQDEDSAAACKQFTSDPRISFTVQENRLGWASNLNWLMEQCDAPFFCYWQQDDICATNYLSSLHACAIANSGAACCYSDIQWFGGLFGRESLPSITGTPLNRVLMQVEKGHFAPFRGLVRKDALHAAGSVRLTSYDSRLEDLVWVAKLARYGDLIRVPDTLYFKRVHRSNAHSSGKSLPDEYRRSVWIEYGLGMIEAALPLVNSVPEQLRLFETVLERILVPRDGRWVFFDPVRDGSANAVSFANDFLDAVLRRFGAEPWSHAARLPDPRAALALVSAHAARVDPASADAVLTGLGLRASRLEE